MTYSNVDLYLESNEKSTICKHEQHAKACDSISYGSAVLGLHKLGLWPRKSANEIHGTVSELVSKLRSLRLDSLPRLTADDLLPPNIKTRGLELNHGNCGFHNFGFKITCIMVDIDDPVLDSHRIHVRARKDN